MDAPESPIPGEGIIFEDGGFKLDQPTIQEELGFTDSAEFNLTLPKFDGGDPKCDDPSCDSLANRTYRGKHGNKLSLCQLCYFALVTGKDRIKTTHTPPKIGVPFCQAGDN